jgi:hypothetical protein
MIDPQHNPARDADPTPTQPPVLPAEQVFLEVGDNAPVAVDVSQAPVPLRKRGPGLWESIAWMVGFYVVQITVMVLAAMALVIAFFVTAAGGNPQGIDVAGLTKSLLPQLDSNLISIIGAAQLATVLYALLAVRLRFGVRGVRSLGLQLPWGGHWLLIALIIAPLSLLCSTLQAAMFDCFPSSRGQMEELMKSLAQAPLSMLVLIIGLGPALCEELLFRGLIGRGLMARHGVIAGIFMTSVLFGLLHINPGQAIAVIPMGMVLHFVYYTTRSFWAPVTLHLFNNSLAVILLKHSSVPAVVKIDQLVEAQGGPPVSILVASVAMVTAILILLWQTRVQFVLRDGTVWNPGFATTSAPPPDVDAIPIRQDPRFLMLAGSTINSLGFAAGVWRLTGWAGLPW